MMFHSLRGLGADPYAGTDALGPATSNVTPSEAQWALNAGTNAPPTSTDLASSTATSDCDPNSQVCHWYCYIPFMATSDCLASFNAGTKTIASSAGSAVGGAINAAATGATKGLADSLLGGDPNSPGLSMSTGLMLAVVGGIAAMVLLSGKK